MKIRYQKVKIIDVGRHKSGQIRGRVIFLNGITDKSILESQNESLKKVTLPFRTDKNFEKAINAHKKKRLLHSKTKCLLAHGMMAEYTYESYGSKKTQMIFKLSDIIEIK